MAAGNRASSTQIDVPAASPTTVANPERTRLHDSFQLIPLDVVTLYGVFNDENRIDELVQSGVMHAGIAEKMKEPLFLSEVAGEAKREQNRLNHYRFQNPTDSLLGPTELREQTVTRTPWDAVTGADWDEIDDGTRANG